MDYAITTVQFKTVFPDVATFREKIIDNFPIAPNLSTLTLNLNEVVEILYNYMYLKFATWEINYDTEEAFSRALILEMSSTVQALVVRLKWIESDFITKLSPEQLLGMGYSNESTDSISSNIPPLIEMLQDENTNIDYNNAKSNQVFSRIVDYKDGYKSIKNAMGTPIGNGINEYLKTFEDLFIGVYSDRREYE